VANGTEALHLALRALEIGHGDEVITVSHTFIATVEAIALVGARPVFVDVDPHTYTMDPALVEAAVTSRTKAIMPVHLYGQPADMNPILEIARRRGLWVVDDAAQAHGAVYHGRRIGGLGDLTGFSFYCSKNLGAYGEAGMVTGRNRELLERVRLLRDHGSRVKYQHEIMGTNGRMDEIQAAILRIKLRSLDAWNAARRACADSYTARLADMGVITPVVASERSHVFHLYVIQTEDRDQLMHHLKEQQIATGVHYPVPVHLQLAAAAYGHRPGTLSVTEDLAPRILSLPMFAEMTATELDAVCGAIASYRRAPQSAS